MRLAILAGLLDVCKKTIASDGIVGLYRGFSVSIIGITVYRGLYFGIYDTMKLVILVGSLKGNLLVSFMLGWSVTTISGIIAYPFDTLRCRMLMTSSEATKYSNTIHAFQHLVRQEDILALFRGVKANIMLGVAEAGVPALYDQLQLLVLMFEKMPERDVVSWNIMIVGYTKIGYCQEALRLYGWMQWTAIEADHVTFASVLGACAGLEALQQGNTVAYKMLR